MIFKMKNIFFRSLFILFTFYISPFTASAQSDSSSFQTATAHLKNSFDGLIWMGTENHFTTKTDSSRTTIFALGGVYLNSNTLPFSFSKKIIQSGFIDDELKGNARNYSHNINSVEAGYKYGAGFCKRWKKNATGLAMSEESISIINYRRDLFNLVFFGNEEYENDTAYLSGSGLVNQDFHRVRFIFSTKSGVGDSSWQINASISYLQGYHVNLFSVGKTKLYTAPMGEYLWLQSKFIYQTNDTSNTGSFAFNGNGISADVCIAFPAGKSQLLFAINDAGFIYWNKKSLLYGMDTTVQFEGVELENILTNSGASVNNINSDTILNYLGVAQNKNGFNLNLPLRFTFIWNRTINNNKIGLNAGFSFLPQYENGPLFFASSTFNFKNFYPSVSVSYGGFQAFNMGINLAGSICKHFNWLIGSGQIVSLVMPERLTGIDLYSQLSYSF